MKRLAWSFAALLVLQLAVFASDKAAKVTLDQPVMVGTSIVAAGTYNVSWTETGPDAKVIFSQGKKSFAVVPATVVMKENSQDRVFTATAGSGRVLQGLDLKHASLSFSMPTTSDK